MSSLLLPTNSAVDMPDEQPQSTQPRVRIWETGMLVSLNVHMWTGTAQLDSDDLGLPDVPELYTLGRKYLVPKHLLRTIRSTASRAYRTLERYSVPFPIGRARFVPITAAPTLFTQLDNIRGEFYCAVVRFLDAYRCAWQAVMSQQYEEAARAAYRVSKATGTSPDLSEEEFVRQYLERTRASYPAPGVLRFHMSYDAYQITAPELRSITSPSQVDFLARTAREEYQRHLESFFEEAVAEIRSRVAAACQEAAQTLSRTQTVTEQTIQALRRMVADFRAINFVNDREVERMLDQLSREYLSGSARTLRETNAIPALRQALDAIAATALDPIRTAHLVQDLRRRIVLE